MAERELRITQPKSKRVERLSFEVSVSAVCHRLVFKGRELIHALVSRCSTIRSFAMEILPRTIPRYELTLCRKRCKPWIWEQSWEPRSSFFGADGKESKPMRAGGPMRESSVCAKP